MIVDVNANVSRWPFRRIPCDELPPLIEKLCAHRVTQAWVGSLDGLFHRDLGRVNLRLTETCRQERGVELIPFGSVNPMLPDWQEDLRRCADDFRMPGIRLHPNYHGYRLDEAVFADLVDLAAAKNLLVQLVVRMDDVRVQPGLMRIPNVDVAPLAEIVRSHPSLRMVLLNALGTLRGQALHELAATGRVWFDISTREGVGGLGTLVREVPPSRVLFGSHLPLFVLESAVLKMRESDLDDRHRRAIAFENAQGLLGDGA